MGRIEFGPLAAQYRVGRALPDWAVEEWRRAILDQIPAADGSRRVVDVGCGTGEWITRLATWLGASVVGIELSAEMARFALERVGTEPVTVARGRAEALPLPDACADAVWISNVLHHVDMRRAAAELRRVVRGDDAPIVVRGYFTELFTPADLERAVAASTIEGEHRTAGMVFPSVLDVLATFPSIHEVDAAFGSAGFERTHAAPVVQGIAADLQTFHDRLSLRADSTLQLIDGDEFAAGLARLRREIAADPERATRPLIGPLPFVVYR